MSRDPFQMIDYFEYLESPLEAARRQHQPANAHVTRRLAAALADFVLPSRWLYDTTWEAAELARALEKRLLARGVKFTSVKKGRAAGRLEAEAGLRHVAAILAARYQTKQAAIAAANEAVRAMLPGLVLVAADATTLAPVDPPAMLRDLATAAARLTREADDEEAKAREAALAERRKGYIRGGVTTWSDDDWREQP